VSPLPGLGVLQPGAPLPGRWALPGLLARAPLSLRQAEHHRRTPLLRRPVPADLHLPALPFHIWAGGAPDTTGPRHGMDQGHPLESGHGARGTERGWGRGKPLICACGGGCAASCVLFGAGERRRCWLSAGTQLQPRASPQDRGPHVGLHPPWGSALRRSGAASHPAAQGSYLGQSSVWGRERCVCSRAVTVPLVRGKRAGWCCARVPAEPHQHRAVLCSSPRSTSTAPTLSTW